MISSHFHNPPPHSGHTNKQRTHTHNRTRQESLSSNSPRDQTCINITPGRLFKKKKGTQTRQTLHPQVKSLTMSLKNETKRHSKNYTTSAPVSPNISRTTSYDYPQPVVLNLKTDKLEEALQRLVQEGPWQPSRQGSMSQQ